MSEYHESWEALPEEVRDQHRALRSVIEEIEAVDWYHQRVALAADPELKAVLAHNRDEEIEHACMALEWLRRYMPAWDENLRKYLFVSGSITAMEEEATGAKEAEGATGRDLGLGSLKGEK